MTEIVRWVNETKKLQVYMTLGTYNPGSKNNVTSCLLR